MIRQTTTGMTIKKIDGMTIFCSETHANFYSEEYEVIKEEAKKYKYVILYRDHYRGNSKGDYFQSINFEHVYRIYDFLFFNSERPVYQIVLTNDSVPMLIEARSTAIHYISKYESELSRINIPSRPHCDGRATERTQPEAFAMWRKEVEEKRELSKELRIKIEDMRKILNAIPKYSTTLVKYE